MEFKDILMIIALIIGPVAAVLIQRWRDHRNLKRERRMHIFRTLMKTRATPLSSQHVEALNMIDMEFYKEKKVINAWKLLLDNFTHYPQNTVADDYKIKLDASTKKSEELRVALLSAMAKALKYDFDEVCIKRDVYVPMGHTEMEFKQYIVLTQLSEILMGNKAFPVIFTNPKSFKITKAIYYSTRSIDKSIDVTDNLKKKVVNGRLKIKVDNDIDHDPDLGAKKKLKIEYDYNDEKKSVEYDEGEDINLPQYS
jgi:hypothetical protein